jgi:toxin YoeB
MEIKFTDSAYEDLEYWKSIQNKKILKRIRELLEAIQQDPVKGIGKPEGLKHNWSGYWSRRINKTHRIIYKVEEDIIMIYSLKDHY